MWSINHFSTPSLNPGLILLGDDDDDTKEYLLANSTSCTDAKMRSDYINSKLNLCLLLQAIFRFCSVVIF